MADEIVIGLEPDFAVFLPVFCCHEIRVLCGIPTLQTGLYDITGRHKAFIIECGHIRDVQLVVMVLDHSVLPMWHEERQAVRSSTDAERMPYQGSFLDI